MSPLFFIRFPDGRFHIPGIFDFWSGFGSNVMSNGPIISFIVDYLSTKKEKTLFICQKADGHYKIPDEIEQIAKTEDAVLIAGVVAGVSQQKHFFYSPASDEFFVNEVYDSFKHHRVPWEKKENILFWRGGVSGWWSYGGSWRIDVVKACLTIPKTDIKFVDCYVRPYCNPTDTPELFADKVDVLDQLKYKALLYLDGNSSASNATWIFASGCVPVFVSIHEFWFRDFLVPWVHYIPVQWDLSDLSEKIQWIWDNDDNARQIAENALELSRTVLSCANQRNYIKYEIDKLIEEHNREHNNKM
jgi:hypothetical protein